MNKTVSVSKGDKVIIASGYFNPLHIGHVRYLEEAKTLGTTLVVIVNNDLQVGLKGSKPCMSEQDRLEIVGALRCVDYAVLSIDSDRSVLKTLASLNGDLFAKGGDSTPENTPEKDIIEVVYNIGGLKIRSSSEILK